MTCKDCIHFGFCWRQQELLDEREFEEEQECCEEASRFIEVPCKVGDTVYYIEGAYYNSKRQTVRPIKVTEISWKFDRSGRDLGFALIAHGTRYKFSSIGKTVFLTKEEAEKALKELAKKTAFANCWSEGGFLDGIDNLVKEFTGGDTE